MSTLPKNHIICIGAVYIDTILTVPHFPIEDEKTRASKLVRRRGGNTANTLEVLGQLLHPPSSSGSTDLHLLAVLPAKSSSAARYISDSLLYVEVDDTCMRDGFEEAASCYVILNEQNMSRTIVSVSGLPEMTAAEFMGAVERMSPVEVGGKLWYHFEGRVPEIILECVKWLRERWGKDVCISVECEKPERIGMAVVARYADVVFYSRLWAEKAGYKSAAEFLKEAVRYEDYVGKR
jgi:ketohexokinase